MLTARQVTCRVCKTEWLDFFSADQTSVDGDEIVLTQVRTDCPRGCPQFWGNVGPFIPVDPAYLVVFEEKAIEVPDFGDRSAILKRRLL
jgi:hypothetical protein